MNVRLIATTQPTIPEARTAEELIAYCARVSSPQNQADHDTAPRLLAYCIRNRHWSVFEQAGFTVEIKTSRAIAQQILRHRSFTFQEFSQRYAVAAEFEPVELRRQGERNRQGGEEVISVPDQIDHPDEELFEVRDRAIAMAVDAYETLIGAGVAKECARMVLPLCTATTLYMTGTVRSWIHYLDQRLDAHAQKEHRLVAREVAKVFSEHFPSIAQALADTAGDR